MEPIATIGLDLAKNVFSCYRLRSDRSLDYVGVELDTTVGQKAFEYVTTLDRVP